MSARFEGSTPNPSSFSEEGARQCPADRCLDWVKKKLVERQRPRREQPAFRGLAREYDPEAPVERFSGPTSIA